MTTLDVVPKKKPESSAEETAGIEQVRLARDQGLLVTGPEGLLEQFTKSVLETTLNEEMTEHLGHAKHPAAERTCPACPAKCATLTNSGGWALNLGGANIKGDVFSSD